MDKIILQQHISKWNEYLRYLKGCESELTVEESSAIEVLKDLWRRRTAFTPDMVQEATEMINTLVNSSKFHGNNRDLGKVIKEFSSIARKFYTTDAATYLEIRTALQPRRTTPQPSPQDPSLTPAILLNYVKEWHIGMQYLLDHEEDLDESEVADMNRIIEVWTGYSGHPEERKAIETAAQSMKDCERLHGSNRDIVTYSKKVTSASRKYITNERLAQAFAKALGEYLRKTPLRRPAPPSGPPIRIKSVSFCSTDYDGNRTSDSADTTTQYLTPILQIERLRQCESTAIYFRLYRADGTMVKNGDRNFTWMYTFTPRAGTTSVVTSGYGNSDGKWWQRGSYRLEFICENTIIYTSNIQITSRTVTPPPPPPRETPQRATPKPAKPKKSGSKWWLWILIAVAGYFGYDYYTEKKADEAATVMYTLLDTDFFKDSGSDPYDHQINDGERVLVYNTTDNPGWAYIKSPEGKKGYVSTRSLISETDNNLLRTVIGEEVNPSLCELHQRAAVVHLLNSGKLGSENPGGWRIRNNGEGLTPNTVNNTQFFDDSAKGFKTLTMLLENVENGKCKIAIYTFQSDGSPELKYITEAPKGKEIGDVSYKSNRKYYYVNYVSSDKRVSSLTKPDEKHPFIITDLKFVDTDRQGNLVSTYVGKRAQYVAPKITYKTNYTGTVELKVKIFDNKTGELLTPSDKKGQKYSYRTSIYTGSKNRGTKILDGWGNPQKTGWSGGVDRRFEIYDGNTLIATGRVAP